VKELIKYFNESCANLNLFIFLMSISFFAKTSTEIFEADTWDYKLQQAAFTISCATPIVYAAKANSNV
jgi:hypothetical protein